GFKFHDDVTEKLARRGVADGALVAQLFELADVVQQRGGEQEIEIEFRIMFRNVPGHAAKTDDVLQQSTKIRVVHHFGGGGALVAPGGARIGDDFQYQLF